MADHADGLLFISEYTRDRFRRRFPVRAGCLSSCRISRSIRPNTPTAEVRVAANRQNGFIFIVGNEYDHKDVAPTMELLATAFPYQSIVALGPAKAATPRVTVLQSGALSEAEIHALYAGARLVVFPSFYEGFGFPDSDDARVRRNAGGAPIDAARRDRGALRAARTRRAVCPSRRAGGDGRATAAWRGRRTLLPLGTALDNGRPLSWQDVGRAILAFLTASHRRSCLVAAGDRANTRSRSSWRRRCRSWTRGLTTPRARQAISSS